MADYVPEIGQAMFGCETFPFDLEDQFPQASNWIRAICELLPTPEGRPCGDADYEDTYLEVHPYWCGDEDAPEASRPNFRFGTIGVRWYKHAGRGMSTNTAQSAMLWLNTFQCAMRHAMAIVSLEAL